MIPILEFQERSLKGPVMKSDEFDLTIAKKVRELVKKYKIKYNPEELIVDDATADAVFQAGIDMLVDVGVLNVETDRVIKWTKEEIEQVAREYRENPQMITFGRGKDAHTVVPRIGTDTRPPVSWCCAAGVIQEDWIIPYLQSCAQEPCVQGFGIAGGIASVDGIVPKAGSPSEIYCGLWEARAQLEAVRRAGRPHMHLGLIPTVSTVGGTAAVLGPGLHEAHNSMIGIHIIPEQKIDLTRLNLALVCEDRGISPWTSTMSLLGGLCGGPAGVAVGMMANFLGQLSYAHGKLGSFYVNDMMGRASHREGLWTYSACFRAAERNIGVATGTCAGDSGMVFSMEEAICRGVSMAITLTACGGGYNWGTGNTGLAARIQHEVMGNIAGMSGDQVNGILKSLSVMFDEMAAAGGDPVGFNDMMFPALYDVKTVKPLPGYLDACKRAVEKLAGCGVPISDKLVID